MPKMKAAEKSKDMNELKLEPWLRCQYFDDHGSLQKIYFQQSVVKITTINAQHEKRPL
jgi:hypothetical protein